MTLFDGARFEAGRAVTLGRSWKAHVLEGKAVAIEKRRYGKFKVLKYTRCCSRMELSENCQLNVHSKAPSPQNEMHVPFSGINTPKDRQRERRRLRRGKLEQKPCRLDLSFCEAIGYCSARSLLTSIHVLAVINVNCCRQLFDLEYR